MNLPYCTGKSLSVNESVHKMIQVLNWGCPQSQIHYLLIIPLFSLRFIFMCVSILPYTFTWCSWCLRRPEEGAGSRILELVTDSCKHPVDAGN